MFPLFFFLSFVKCETKKTTTKHNNKRDSKNERNERQETETFCWAGTFKLYAIFKECAKFLKLRYRFFIEKKKLLYHYYLHIIILFRFFCYIFLHVFFTILELFVRFSLFCQILYWNALTWTDVFNSFISMLIVYCNVFSFFKLTISLIVLFMYDFFGIQKKNVNNSKARSQYEKWTYVEVKILSSLFWLGFQHCYSISF